MKIEDYYLDLDKVSSLKTEDERQNIHNYYRDMMGSYVDGRTKQAKSIMNTLVRGGYLKNITQKEREEKIETILG